MAFVGGFGGFSGHAHAPQAHLATGVAHTNVSFESARTSTYRVQSGNTLGFIAQKYGMSIHALANLNHITNINLIEIGQLLQLSASSHPVVHAKASPVFHTVAARSYRVRSGDTLGLIASKFGTTVQYLAQLNHLANPNVISVGQVLTVSGSPTSASHKTSSVPKTTTSNHSASSSTHYAVRSGDTLGTIAAHFHISWQTLAAYNHLANPNVISVGQVLAIPGSSVSHPSGTGSSSASQSLPVQAPGQAFNQAIVKTAKSLLGIAYHWGGTSPSTGFDCSGLVQYVFKANGIANMPRTSYAQYSFVTHVSKSQLVPGDLVFFQTYASGASHVAIYIGSADGFAQAAIDAPAPGQSVRIFNMNSAYFAHSYYGAGYVKP